MTRLAVIALVPLLLAACATDSGYRDREREGRPGAVMPNPPPQQASPLARTVTYACEDLSTVLVTEGTGEARVKTNSGLELALARRPSAGGFRYGDRSYEFSGGGSEALLTGNGKTWRCRMR